MNEQIQVDENPIVFFCKDCEELVETEKVGNKYVYKCRKCGTKNVAFGTLKSVSGFFRIEEREKQKRREEDRAKKAGKVPRAAVKSAPEKVSDAGAAA